MAAIGFHFQANTISRSKGQSAVASVAYRTAEKIHDDRIEKTFDYQKKGGVEYVHHAAPKNAPEWAQSIGTAWNTVEATENRKNSTLAFEYVAAFPHQLTAEQRAYILKDFMREELTRKHFMATGAIHEPNQKGDDRNYHAHIMVWDRPINADGAAAHKDRRFSDLKQRGETLEEFKEKWATLGARQLEKAGYEVEAERWRHGYKTLEQQTEAAKTRGDLDYLKEIEGREATKHIGVKAVGMERKGEQTERGDLHRETEARNSERQTIQIETKAAYREARKLWTAHQAEEEQKSQAPEPSRVKSAVLNHGLGATISAVESVAGILENFFVPQHKPQPTANKTSQALPSKSSAQIKEEHAKISNEAEQAKTVKRDNYGVEIQPDTLERIRRQWEEDERNRSEERGGHER